MPKETTISDTFSCRGFWWTPDAPENRVPGTLSYDPTGERHLELDGLLQQGSSKGQIGFLHLPYILGETLDGKACTLVDAYQTSLLLPSPGLGTTRFSVSQILIGDEHVDPNSKTYESALIALTDLRAWMGRVPFTDQFGPGGASVSTMFTPPPIITIDVAPLQSVISIEAAFGSSMDYYSRTMTYDEFLRMSPKKAQPVEWYFQTLFRLRILLGLLVGRPVHLKRVQLCTSIEEPGLSGKPIRHYVDLCRREVGFKQEKEILAPQMPFPYPMLSDEWPQTLEVWFSRSQSLNTLAGLLFGVSIDPSMPVEFQFLSLIQGIESYHRTQGDDVYLSKSDYEPIKKALFEAIPYDVNSDHRDALKKRIEHGNEYSLRKRLQITLQSMPKALAASVTNGNDKFIAQVVDTRNYLTHRDETEKSEVLDLPGTFDASVSLKMLAEFLLLKEVGMPVDILSKVMRTHPRYVNRPKIL